MTQAHLMVSNSELPSYRYDASGETSTSRKYSAIKFHTICQGSLVWKGIGQYLQSQGISEKYKGDLEWLRFCILGDAANRYPNLVTDGEQPAAFDALLEQWPLHSAVAALALFHWNSAPQTLRPALESRTASSSTHPGNRLSIALFPSARKDTECCLALAAAVDSWASLGAQITLFGESAPSSLTKNHSIAEISSHLSAAWGHSAKLFSRKRSTYSLQTLIMTPSSPGTFLSHVASACGASSGTDIRSCFPSEN